MSNHFDNDNDSPLPDWLSGAESFGDDEPAKPPPPPEPSADEPAPDWLTSAQQFTGDKGASSPQQEVGYDEWMQQEEEKNKPRPIEEEVPDWFQDVDSGSAEAESSDTGSFVPDWFMGLEEQSLDEAPDWVKNTGSVDASSLTDTSAFDKPTEAPRPSKLETFTDSSSALPEPEPELPLESEAEMPDWFSADDTPSETIEPAMPDFDFGSPNEDNFASTAPDADLMPDFDFGNDLADELVLDSADDLMPDLDFDMPIETRDDFADVDMPDFNFDELEADSEPEPVAPPPPPLAEPVHNPDLDWLDDMESDISAEATAAEQTKLANLDFAEDSGTDDDLFGLGDLGLDFGEVESDDADALFANLAADDDDISWADNTVEDSSTIPFPPEDLLDAQSVDDDLFASLEGGSDDLSDTDSANWLEGAVPTVSYTAGAEDVGFGFDFSELDENDMGFDFDKYTQQQKEAEAALETDDDALDDTLSPPRRPGMTAPLGATASLIEEMDGSDLDDLFGDLDENAFDVSTPDVDLAGASKQELAMTGALFMDEEDNFFAGLEDIEAEPSLSLTRDFDTGELTSDTDLDLSDLGVSPAEQRAQLTPADTSDLARTGDQPEWISDLRPDMPVKLNAGNLEFDMQQTKLSDMDDALKALRDRTAAFTSQQSQTADTTEASPSSGILAGIGGLTSSRVIEEVSDDFELTNTLRISDAQLGRVAILDSALAHIRREQEARRKSGLGAQEMPDVVKVKTRAKFKIDRLLIVVVLFAVLLAPFITDALHLDAIEPTTEFSGEQMAVVEAVDSIETGDYVLLSFDYGPTSAYELDPLAETLLRDIIKQGGIPVITSISPLGALNSRMVMDDLRDDEDFLETLGRDKALAPRVDYYTLRYLAGDTVGVRGLADSVLLGEFIFGVDSDGEDTNLNIRKLEATDFAMIVVIGEGVDDTRRWAEQADIDDLSKYLLTTASAEPLAKTYVKTSGTSAYQGYLAGYRDTQIYNALRNPEAIEPSENLDEYNLPDTHTAQWYSISLAVLGAVVIIGLGLIINLVRRIGGRS